MSFDFRGQPGHTGLVRGVLGTGMVTVLLVGCGSTSGLDAGNGGDGECRIRERFTIHRGHADSFVAGLALRGDEVGLLWFERAEPWKLMFGAFPLGDPEIHEPVEIDPVAPHKIQIGFQPFGDGFAVAWTDFQGCQPAESCPGMALGELHITLLAGGQVIGDKTLGTYATAGWITTGVVLGIVGGGTMLVAWPDWDDAATATSLKYAMSTDGSTFSEPVVLRQSTVEVGLLSVAMAPPGLGMTWEEQDALWNVESDGTAPNAVLFATFDANGRAAEPHTLVEHPARSRNGIGQTATAFGGDVFAVATIDFSYFPAAPRVAILSRDGAVLDAGGPLDSDDASGLDLAWGGRAFAVSWMTGFGNDERVLLRQVAPAPPSLPDRLDIAGPMRLGHLLVEGPKLVSMGNDRYFAMWQEPEGTEDDALFVLRAAEVSCWQ